MAQVLEDKPGLLVATIWTSESDPPLLVCTIYVANLMCTPQVVLYPGLSADGSVSMVV